MRAEGYLNIVCGGVGVGVGVGVGGWVFHTTHCCQKRVMLCLLSQSFSLLISLLVVSIFMMYIQVGYSALIVAVRWGRTGAVKELVKGGADLNLQNKVCQ